MKKINKLRLRSAAPRDVTNVVVQTNPDYANLSNTTILPEVVVEKKNRLYDGTYQEDKRDRDVVNNNRPSYTDALFSAAGFLGKGLQVIPHKGVQTAGKLLSLADFGYDIYKVSKNNNLNNRDTEDLVSDVTLGNNYKPPISKIGSRSKNWKLRLLYYLTNSNAVYHDFAGMTNTDVVYSPYKKNTSYSGVYR